MALKRPPFLLVPVVMPVDHLVVFDFHFFAFDDLFFFPKWRPKFLRRFEHTALVGALTATDEVGPRVVRLWVCNCLVVLVTGDVDLRIGRIGLPVAVGIVAVVARHGIAVRLMGVRHVGIDDLAVRIDG